MNCKISRSSLKDFVIIAFQTMAVWAIIYYLAPWMVPFYQRFPILTWVILISVLCVSAFFILNDNSFNVKGYFVFAACSVVVYWGIIWAMIALFDACHIRQNSFPFVPLIVGAIIFIALLKLYYCVIRCTLLKTRALIKKRLEVQA